MGLDVYLYKYDNKAESDKLEAEHETISEANWKAAGKYDTLTQPQKDAVYEKNKAAARTLGLNEDGGHPAKQRIEINSKIDPEHYFKIGYFRSSYNDGGINRVLGNLGISDLYDIFQPKDEYCFQPKWNACLKKTEKAIEALEKTGNYSCFDISPNVFGGDLNPSSEKEALEAFMKEIKEGGTSFDAYSNKTGHFYVKEPLKVLALIPGTNSILRSQIPCTYVICEGNNQWYINALKIVKETIEYVMAQPDPEKYYLHWSS